MMRNKGNRPLAVTAIALLSLATGLLTLLATMVHRGGYTRRSFYFALRMDSISQIWNLIFGILIITVSVAMFYGFKWVWYASMAIWTAEVISWIAETITLSYTIGISFFIILNMWYFFRHDIQEYFSVKAFWTWE